MMTVYYWSQLTLEQRAEAMPSACMAGVHSSIQARKCFDAAQRTDAEADSAAIWIDHGNGRWTAQAAIWPSDLVKGVRIGGKK